MANWHWNNCGKPLKEFVGLVEHGVLSADTLKCPGFLISLSEKQKDAMQWLLGKVSPVLDDYLFYRCGLTFGKIKFDEPVLALLKFSESYIPEFANILDAREASGAKRIDPRRHIDTLDIKTQEVVERLALPCMD